MLRRALRCSVPNWFLHGGVALTAGWYFFGSSNNIFTFFSCWGRLHVAKKWLYLTNDMSIPKICPSTSSETSSETMYVGFQAQKNLLDICNPFQGVHLGAESTWCPLENAFVCLRAHARKNSGAAKTHTAEQHGSPQRGSRGSSRNARARL